MIILKINRIKIIYVLLILVLVGCNSQEKKQEEIKIEDKAPDSLKELSSGIDDIFKSLGDIERLSLGIKLPKEDKKPKRTNQAVVGKAIKKNLVVVARVEVVAKKAKLVKNLLKDRNRKKGP